MLTEEMDTCQKEQESGATSTGVDEVNGWMSSLDDDLFGGGRTRTRQSRAQKRAERHAYVKDMAESDDSALADFQSEVCQKTSQHRPRRVPLSPLPVVEEAFGQIATDIVGPLPKSRLGKRYVMVICDYATRYPEAVH